MATINGDLRLGPKGLALVYGLADPWSGELRYIGQTSRPLNTRLRQHVRVAKKSNRYRVSSWILGLEAAGAKPEVFEIEASESINDAEVFWIEYFRFLGCRLLNQTNGGEGVRGWHHSEDQKQKWSRDRRGVNGPRYGVALDQDGRARASASAKARYASGSPHPRKGKKHSPETIAKIKAAMAAKPYSERNITPEGLSRRLDALSRARRTRSAMEGT